MRAKVLVFFCTVLALVLSRYSKTSSRLALIETSYSHAGESDLPADEWRHPSPETLGHLYRISSGQSGSISHARKIAEELARKRHHDQRWTENFMRGYTAVTRSTLDR